MTRVAPCFLLVIALVSPLEARDIVFPRLGSWQHAYAYQSPLSNSEPDLLGDTAFNGLTTFAHLPYVPCMASDYSGDGYDIAFLGAPFDTVCRRSRYMSFWELL